MRKLRLAQWHPTKELQGWDPDLQPSKAWDRFFLAFFQGYRYWLGRKAERRWKATGCQRKKPLALLSFLSLRIENLLFWTSCL